MFSATKFVIAGVIVARFGGLLLAGVLTQQGDETLPAVGASQSAAPPSEAASATTPDEVDVPPRETRVGEDEGILETPLGPMHWVHIDRTEHSPPSDPEVITGAPGT